MQLKKSFNRVSRVVVPTPSPRAREAENSLVYKKPKEEEEGRGEGGSQVALRKPLIFGNPRLYTETKLHTYR